MPGAAIEDAQRPLRLLSLDGGGVRGLSSIIILKHIMKGVSAARGRPVHPWEEFDMIGGTSTGGESFNPKRHHANLPGQAKDFLQADGRFDSKELEDAIKDVIADHELPENALLRDPASPCKVFVCAVSTSNTGAAILRSYENNEWPMLLYDECKIWEACRATSAATTFSDPITIGPFDQKFVDGACLYNNPIQLVHREAQSIWPNRIADAVLVSIGTGSAPGKAFEGNIKKIVDVMKSIVTQTERTADDFISDHGSMADRDLYFRFNVFHGLADVGLEEYKEKAKMADATHAYLGNGETRKKVKACLGKFSLLRLEAVATESDHLQTQVPRLPLAALHDACSEADLDKISSLVDSSADINGLDSRGFTPLMVACEKDDRKVVEFLLSRGADIKGDYSPEKSPVSIAIENGSTDMVTLLFDKGVPVNGRIKFKTLLGDIHATPLGQAARKGDEALVELMLKRGADINARQGLRGWTPLHHAVHYKHKAVITLLLQYGAKRDIKNSEGYIALDPYGWVGMAGQENLVILQKIIDDMISKGMYSESAELLSMSLGGLRKELKRASQQGANAKPKPNRAPVGPATPQPPNQQPAYYQPTNQQPTNQQPINQQPTNQQPTNQQPTYYHPTHQQPPYQQPAYYQPANHQLAHHQPAYHQPVPGPSSYPPTQAAVYELPTTNGGPGSPRAPNPQSAAAAVSTNASANVPPSGQRESNGTGRLGRFMERLKR